MVPLSCAGGASPAAAASWAGVPVATGAPPQLVLAWRATAVVPAPAAVPRMPGVLSVDGETGTVSDRTGAAGAVVSRT